MTLETLHSHMQRVSSCVVQVLYCGDHVQSDIIQPVRCEYGWYTCMPLSRVRGCSEYGWQTACITSEVEHEVLTRMQPEQQVSVVVA